MLHSSKHGNFERMSVLANHRASESLGQRRRCNSVQGKSLRVWRAENSKRAEYQALGVFAILILPGSMRHGLPDSVGLCASVGKVIPVQLCRQAPPVMAL